MIGVVLHRSLNNRRETAQNSAKPGTRFALQGKNVSVNAGMRNVLNTRKTVHPDRYPSTRRRSDLPRVRPPFSWRSLTNPSRQTAETPRLLRCGIAFFEHLRYISRRIKTRAGKKQAYPCVSNSTPSRRARPLAWPLAATHRLNRALSALALAPVFPSSPAVIWQPARFWAPSAMSPIVRFTTATARRFPTNPHHRTARGRLPRPTQAAPALSPGGFGCFGSSAARGHGRRTGLCSRKS